MTRQHHLESTLRTLKLGGMLETLEVRLAQARAGEVPARLGTPWVHQHRYAPHRTARGHIRSAGSYTGSLSTGCCWPPRAGQAARRARPRGGSQAGERP
jgi:hypothetical protein